MTVLHLQIRAGGSCADTNAACDSNQLYTGLEAGIKASISTDLKRIEMNNEMIFSEDELDNNI